MGRRHSRPAIPLPEVIFNPETYHRIRAEELTKKNYVRNRLNPPKIDHQVNRGIVPLLEDLCIQEIATAIAYKNYYMRHIQNYPSMIKDKFLAVANRKTKLLNNIRLVAALVHPNVRELNFDKCTMTDDILRVISVCHKLRKLTMDGNENVSKDVLQDVIPLFPEMEEFVAFNFAAIDDDIINLMVESWPRLHTLDISKCSMTSDAFNNLGKFRLKSLCVTGVQFWISDENIDNLLAGCEESLEELHIPLCTEEYEIAMKTKFKNLKIFETYLHLAIVH